MEPQANKARRLAEIEQLLLRHKDGLTIPEIARKIGVNRSTVWHYYEDGDLPLAHYQKGADGRIRLDPDRLHFNIKLDMDEALALYLAVRLFSTRMDKHNPAAAAAIRKISTALEKVAPPISAAIAKSADQADGDTQLFDPQFIEVLKTIARAWAQGRKMHIVYTKDEGESEYVFSPYFLEPYAIGQTVYVIGRVDRNGALRTFKVERIRQADLLAENYTIPEDFDAAAYLADAWGIWTSDGEPVEVKLRFSPRVARRVKKHAGIVRR